MNSMLSLSTKFLSGSYGKKQPGHLVLKTAKRAEKTLYLREISKSPSSSTPLTVYVVTMPPPVIVDVLKNLLLFIFFGFETVNFSILYIISSSISATERMLLESSSSAPAFRSLIISFLAFSTSYFRMISASVPVNLVEALSTTTCSFFGKSP